MSNVRPKGKVGINKVIGLHMPMRRLLFHSIFPCARINSPAASVSRTDKLVE